jgi:hypothetical protein
MSVAEITTTTIIAALNFGGNFERARLLLNNPRYSPQRLNKSQLQSPPASLA